MNFADELRKAPIERAKQEEEKRKRDEEQRKKQEEEEKRQKEKDWEYLVEKWYTDICKRCKSYASSGETSCRAKFSMFIKDIKNESLPLRENEKAWWKRIESVVFCRLNPRHDLVTAGLSEEHYQKMCADIGKKLRSDGLSVEFGQNKSQKYRLGIVQARRSKLDQFSNGISNLFFDTDLDTSERYERMGGIKDGFWYDVIVTVSW